MILLHHLAPLAEMQWFVYGLLQQFNLKAQASTQQEDECQTTLSGNQHQHVLARIQSYGLTKMMNQGTEKSYYYKEFAQVVK
jgi:hypothetical protein